LLCLNLLLRLLCWLLWHGIFHHARASNWFK
jgi:hypothetical protein